MSRYSALRSALTTTILLAVLAAAIDCNDTKLDERQAVRARPGSCPTINGDSISRFCEISTFISWSNDDVYKWDSTPQIDITIAGIPLLATVDTGSTGLSVWKSALGEGAKKFNLTGPVTAHVYYSDGWLESGYAQFATIEIGSAVSYVQIVVKVREVCCPGFVDGADGHDCPSYKKSNPLACRGNKKRDGSLADDRDTSTIRQSTQQSKRTANMGIGFGLGEPPMNNPLLALTKLKGKDIAEYGITFCKGYIITSFGIYLGLDPHYIDKNDLKGTGLVQTLVKGQVEWETPPMEFKIGSEPVDFGSILVDTSLSDTLFASDPDWAAYPVSDLVISVPGFNNLMSFRYRVGDDSGLNPMAPKAIGQGGTSKLLKAGRKFLNCFDIAYGYDSGYFGYSYRKAQQGPVCDAFVNATYGISQDE